MKLLLKITCSVSILFINGLFLTAIAQIKPTAAAERMKGLEKRKVLEQNSLLKDIQFRNIGPTQMNVF